MLHIGICLHAQEYADLDDLIACTVSILFFLPVKTHSYNLLSNASYIQSPSFFYYLSHFFFLAFIYLYLITFV